jgi:spermidine synthase
MNAGRLVQRHLGSSVYGWTSVIGVLLAGLSLGNYLGGKIADLIKRESQVSWLFLVASILTLMILPLETPTEWMAKAWGDPFPSEPSAFLSRAITMNELKLGGEESSGIPMPWAARVLLVVTAVFLLPSVAMGTVSPVVAKLAVERRRRSKQTGAAIGQVYAWGMVGSILGTFLTGFVLIDVLGTKGVVLVLATMLALAATMLGSILHAAWAGIPLGLCIIAFIPIPWFRGQWIQHVVTEIRGDPNTTEDAIAYTDESDYYYIKISNEPDADGQKRTLVLDNLIHGYFIKDHPERLDYDYEQIYALVGHRVAMAKAQEQKLPADQKPALKVMFLGGGSYTFPRYLQHTYPGTASEIAEIDPAVTAANRAALWLPEDPTIQTTWGDARQFVERNQDDKQYDMIFGDAFNDFSVPWHLTTREFNDKLAKMLTPDGVYMINIIDLYESDDEAEETGRTLALGEARREAERKARAAGADDEAVKKARAEAQPSPEAVERAVAQEKAYARSCGGFLGAWVKTARETFPHLYVFGTNENPGTGGRETFVVVASKKPLDLSDLGGKESDPEFFQRGKLFEPRPYSDEHMRALDVRSRGIILTDDYAPVENLLAPVAATRGKD